MQRFPVEQSSVDGCETMYDDVSNEPVETETGNMRKIGQHFGNDFSG